MKEIVLVAIALVMVSLSHGQSVQEESAVNTSSRMLADPDKLTIGGYGQIDFNQPIVPEPSQMETWMYIVL